MLHPKSAIFMVPYTIFLLMKHTYQTVEKVLRFDVSMDDILGVQVLEGLAHLPNVVRSDLLCIPGVWLLFQVLIELTPWGVL